VRIPHAFRCYGKTYRVRWWKDREKGFLGFNPKLHDGHSDDETRLITLGVWLRGKPRLAFEVFLHEVIHVVNFEERKRPGRSRYRIRHETMYHLDEALAGALLEMGVTFRCVCRDCRPRRGSGAAARRKGLAPVSR